MHPPCAPPSAAAPPAGTAPTPSPWTPPCGALDVSRPTLHVTTGHGEHLPCFTPRAERSDGGHAARATSGAGSARFQGALPSQEAGGPQRSLLVGDSLGPGELRGREPERPHGQH